MFLCVVLYILTLFFGLVLGFTYKGGLFLLIGILTSAYSFVVWNDPVFAKVAAFLSTALATYFFMAKDHRH
jgi:hypothetical protein